MGHLPALGTPFVQGLLDVLIFCAENIPDGDNLVFLECIFSHFTLHDLVIHYVSRETIHCYSL